MKKFIARYSSLTLAAVAFVFVVTLKGAIGEVEAPKELLK